MQFRQFHAAAVAAALAALVPGHAAGAEDGKERSWQAMIGGGASLWPDYEGSDDYEPGAMPLLVVSYRDLVFLSGPSLGANLLTMRGPGPGNVLQAGPLVRYGFGRDEDDNDALRGLGDVDASVEIGGFVRYGMGDLSAELKAFKDVADGHDGILAELTLGYRRQLGQRWHASAELAATWADDNYMQTFFGITAAQAQASGLRRFDAEAGFKDVGVSLGLNYAFTEHWFVGGRAGYTRLVGDAADSPLVDDEGSADQFNIGLMVGYRF